MESNANIKLSIVLPEDLVEMMNIFSQPYKNQSQFIEKAIQQFIANIKQEEQHRRDLELINHHADRLNQEMHDALEYQMPL